MTLNSTHCPVEKNKIQSKLKEAEEKVTNLMADENAKVVEEHLSQLNSINGNFSQIKMWKLKNKLLPRPTDPPMAKKDKGGNLVTAPPPSEKALFTNL